MTLDFVTLKAAVPLESIVLETHSVDRQNRVLCPLHDDKNPSCVIYADGHFFCYACGAHGDVFTWFEAVHGLTFTEALSELERRAGGFVPKIETEVTPPKRTAPSFTPVSANVLIAHRLQAARLEYIPASLEGRGFVVDNLHRLGVAAHADDAILPIPDPTGRVLALKRRHAAPKSARYSYVTPGCGSPAWCSPNFLEREEVLVIEGELNGIAAWLARPDIAVQGIAGSNGIPHLDVLRGRVVFVYGDDDKPGQRARDKWAALALDAGARKVYTLEPWPLDACEIAGTQGRNALLELLT